MTNNSGKGSHSVTNAETDAKKNIAATIAQGVPAKPTTWRKTESVCPRTSRPPKESFDIWTIHGDGDRAAEIWFDQREAGEVEIKSLENRAFDRGAICDVHFFHAIGRARFSLHLETEIGMLLER